MTSPSLPYCFVQAPRARAHLDRVQRRRLVDQDRRFGQAPERRSTASPSRPAASRPVRSLCWSSRPTEPIIRIASCDAPISIENTATGSFRFERDVLADVERERGLAHRRPARDDDEVARLQARRHPVEVGEAGRPRR